MFVSYCRQKVFWRKPEMISEFIYMREIVFCSAFIALNVINKRSAYTNNGSDIILSKIFFITQIRHVFNYVLFNC